MPVGTLCVESGKLTLVPLPVFLRLPGCAVWVAQAITNAHAVVHENVVVAITPGVALPANTVVLGAPGPALHSRTWRLTLMSAAVDGVGLAPRGNHGMYFFLAGPISAVAKRTI